MFAIRAESSAGMSGGGNMADNPNFPIGTAAVSWLDGGGTIHIRVYSSDGYNVTERCWDGSGWTNGSFAQQAVGGFGDLLARQRRPVDPGLLHVRGQDDRMVHRSGRRLVPGRLHDRVSG